MRRRLLVYSIPGAVIVNLCLLGLAPLLSHERPLPKSDDLPNGVSLVNLAPPAPTEKEEVKEPEPPPQQEQPDFQPDLVRPQLSGLLGSDIGAIAIDLGGIGGGASETEVLFEAYELDQAPYPIVNTPPAYPYRARERGIEGDVQIKFLVRDDGSVGQVLILQAKPPEIMNVFRDTIMKTVPTWRFSPGKVEGEPVIAWVVTTLHFTLPK